MTHEALNSSDVAKSTLIRPSDTFRILRYEAPVDDQWHLIRVPNPILVLEVGCRDANVVEFWSPDIGMGDVVRAFRVYGTGMRIPAAATYVGTVTAPGGRLVWHLVSAAGEL